MIAEITRRKIDGWRFGLPAQPQAGAEVVFTGIVRDTEDGRRIGALVYEHYEGMAQRELEKLALEAAERFGIIDLHCVHRVGVIPVHEAAIVVLVRSRHRAEGFAAASWFMDRLKEVVPIWKTGSTEP